MPHKPDTPCAVCGKLLWSAQTSRPAGERTCRECRRAGLGPVDESKRGPRPKSCACCGEPFVAVSQTKYGWTRSCSKRCATLLRGGSLSPEEQERRRRERWQQKNRRRRAILQEVASEPYSLSEIAERDGFSCQLCDGPVDMAMRHPDPKSPSVDHIVPIAARGPDTRGNVQLAHLGCNASKGASVGQVVC